jgi:hypothetical protein
MDGKLTWPRRRPPASGDVATRRHVASGWAAAAALCLASVACDQPAPPQAPLQAPPHSRPDSEPLSPPHTAQRPPLLAPQAQLDGAIADAIAWLSRALDNEWPADVAALLGFMGRAFDAPGLDALAQKALAAADAEVAAQQGLTQPFYRLIDPGVRPSAVELRAVAGLTGAVTAQALHCDWLPLAAEFWPALDRLAVAGGYGSTHAMLATVWIEENACKADPVRLVQLRADGARRLVELLDRGKAPTDLQAEALAMLFYTRQSAKVDSRHIDSLLALRRDDGGWALDGDRASSHPHTTALALWVLLEARHPQRARVPMIPRRVGG